MQPEESLTVDDADAQLRRIAELRAEANRLEQSVLSNISIVGLDLSMRAQNALIHSGIHTLVTLTSLTRKELLRIPNLGSGSAKEIETALALKSLRLCEEYPLMIDCAQCGKHFIKDHQSRLFCSPACRRSGGANAKVA
jgi:DNA-directed RNA polymerase alpha subunit